MKKINTTVKAVKFFVVACIGGGVMATALNETGGATLAALSIIATALAARLERQTNNKKTNIRRLYK